MRVDGLAFRRRRVNRCELSRWSERLQFWQRWHAYVLDRKGVADGAALRAAIDRDRVVALAAARTLLEGATTRALLDEFFADRTDVLADVVAVADESVVNHIGFQIHEPLDVFLEGLPKLAPRFDLHVVGTKRFTASEAFRHRVGAFAEMAQIWLRHDGTTVELELFDIHRPNPGGDRQLVDQVDVLAGTRALLAAARPDVLRSVLADDDVWHYGVRIIDEAAVEQLHGQLRMLAGDDDRFRLRNEETVSNRWHGSVHTKLINLALDLEIEFLTYRVEWRNTGVR